MEAKIVVTLDEKEVRDAIATAAKEKVGVNAGSYCVTIVNDEGRTLVDKPTAEVKFQYTKK